MSQSEADEGAVRVPDEPGSREDILNELKRLNRWNAALNKLPAASSLGFSDEPAERILYVNPKGQSAWAMKLDDSYDPKPHTLTCLVDGVAWRLGKGYDEGDEKALIVSTRDDIGPLQIYVTLQNTFNKSLLTSLARTPEERRSGSASASAIRRGWCCAQLTFAACSCAPGEAFRAWTRRSCPPR